MSYKIVYSGKVKEGKLHIVHRALFDKDLTMHEGKEVEITIVRKRKKRSLGQNAYYWYIVIPLITQGLRDLGNDIDNNDAHEFLKANFCTKQIVNEQTGEIYTLPQSTTSLTTTGFMEFKDAIQKFASEFLNIYIPDPNEQADLQFEQE